MIAYLALLLFVPAAVLVFGRMPRAAATAVVVICGSLLLPEQVAVDLPVVPPLDKEYITYLALLLAASQHQAGALRSARFGRGLEWLIVPMVLGIVGSAVMNPDPFVNEGYLAPGRGLYWILATTTDELLTLALPFFLGRALIRTTSDLQVLFAFLALSGALYLVPILVETVMALPFHVWQIAYMVYGISIQPTWRWGFLQPHVLMDNALALATYLVGAVAAAAAFVKARLRIRGWSSRAVLVACLFGLLLTLNVAGNLYGLTLACSFALFHPRRIAALALALALVPMTYPILRTTGMFPRESLVVVARDVVNPERARSLDGRFQEEDHVLGHIGDRLWFGWAGFDRTPGALTFGEGEPGLDGWWTIQLGARGLVGVLLWYALLGIPVFLAWRSMDCWRSYREQALVAALMSIVAVRMIDLLINGWWNHLPVFLAGALYGLARAQRAGLASGPRGRPRWPAASRNYQS